MRNPVPVNSEDRSPSETSHLCSLAGRDCVVDRSVDPHARSAPLPTQWLASGGHVLGGRARASRTVRCRRAGAGRALAERRERELGGIAVRRIGSRASSWPYHGEVARALRHPSLRLSSLSELRCAQALEKFSDSSYATFA